MKKLLFTTSFLASTMVFAQAGLSTMVGNTSAFADNPGANTGVGAFVWLPQLTVNTELSQSIPSLWGDVAENLINMDAGELEIHGQVDLNLVGAGISFGQHKVWMTKGMSVDVAVGFDKDLAAFALRGMEDAQGQIDPNYSGDFSDNQLGVTLWSNQSIGWQGKLNSKLRVGMAYNSRSAIVAMRAKTNSFTFESNDLGNNINEISVNLDADFGLYSSIYEFNADTTLEGALGEFTEWIGQRDNVSQALLSQARQSSWDFGLSYQFNPKWTFTASYLGLGKSIDLREHGLGYGVDLNLDYGGFNYDLGDSASHPQYYYEDLGAYLQDSVLNTSYTPSWVISPYRGAHIGAMWQPSLSHTFNVDFWERVRSFHRTHTVGISYQYQPTRGFQWAIGYRQPVAYSDGRLPSISTRMQVRLLPYTFMNLSLANVNMLPYPESGDPASGTWNVSSQFNRVNASVGITMMLWDKDTRESYKSRKTRKKSEKEARREAKKESREL